MLTWGDTRLGASSHKPRQTNRIFYEDVFLFSIMTQAQCYQEVCSDCEAYTVSDELAENSEPAGRGGGDQVWGRFDWKSLS